LAERTKARDKNLVIVESAAKARTIERYLGSGFAVQASVGHVRDLQRSRLGVDVENDFEPKYSIVSDRRKVVSQLKAAAKKAEIVYLATDPDREGEAISWHLSQILGIPENDARRVVFHEITKDAVMEAFREPRSIDHQLVEAQQARRILDRLVGFKLSPFIRKKVAGAQSAGRVQSVALRLVVDREAEIEAFIPKEYWLISADLGKHGSDIPINARLYRIHGEKKDPSKPENGLLSDEAAASAIVADLRNADYSVATVTKRQVKIRPRPPFITSTLQQQAARSLRFSAQRTMSTAQALYEGVILGDGEPVGLITYMRTDSTNLATSALEQAQAFIQKEFGEKYTNGHRVYRTRSRNAQEAHEAIRPTSIINTPERVSRNLSSDQRKLYELIWRRTVASQMSDGLDERTRADIDAETTDGKTHILRATGSMMIFDGFRSLYIETKDEDSEGDDAKRLPALDKNENLNLLNVNSDQKFTQPPPRYTEANLIRTLEELGIGRPSTYATIVGRIVDRNYVTRERSRFHPTKSGIAVCAMLKDFFPDIVDVGFTAGMETKLDEIASGDLQRVAMLREFYGPFDSALDHAFQTAQRVRRSELDVASGIKCEGGTELVVRNGRRGDFLACPEYPACRFAMALRPSDDSDGEKIEEWQGEFTRRMSQCHVTHPDGVPELEKRVEVGSGVICDGGVELVVRNGRRGEFLACPEFPKCRVALDLKPSDESDLEEWDEKRKQRMQRCFKEHPEAAKRRATRTTRSRSRTGTRRARTAR
jgi:DNA topoisomerase-1